MPPSLDSHAARKARMLALGEWLVLGALVGIVCGTASAAFLALLELATDTRTSHGGLVWLLPVAGLAIGTLYQRYGASVRGGNDLVIDALHDDGPALPLRMAPMVLLGTVLTHLFGGSAGREGTAVQMGASLTDALAQRLQIRLTMRRELLAAGVAGGFGSVFGTPIAGAIFAFEFVVLGRLELHAILPVLVAALVGDMTTRAWGAKHTQFPSVPALDLSMWVLLKWLLFALVVALVTVSIIELLHALKRTGERYLPALGKRMLVGGVLVVLLWRIVGSSDYLGLGVPTIVRAFEDPGLPITAFAWKVVFTALTIGAGFIGGEVTPLFFVGATLGNVLARGLDLPLALAAGVGMVATFGSAANAPLALSVMAVELLGANALPHAFLVCTVSYLLTGHRGIYGAQRLAHEKAGAAIAYPLTLREHGVIEQLQRRLERESIERASERARAVAATSTPVTSASETAADATCATSVDDTSAPVPHVPDPTQEPEAKAERDGGATACEPPSEPPPEDADRSGQRPVLGSD